MMVSLLGLFLALAAQAQFDLTNEGFVAKYESSKRYVVKDFPEMSREQLMQAVELFFYGKAIHPLERPIRVTDDIVTFSSVSRQRIYTKELFTKRVYDLYYRIMVRCKDGRVRIDAPVFACEANDSVPYRLVLGGPKGEVPNGTTTEALFKKNGMAKNMKAVDMIEEFFNDLCNELYNALRHTDW